MPLTKVVVFSPGWEISLPSLERRAKFSFNPRPSMVCSTEPFPFSPGISPLLFPPCILLWLFRMPSSREEMLPFLNQEPEEETHIIWSVRLQGSELFSAQKESSSPIYVGKPGRFQGLLLFQGGRSPVLALATGMMEPYLSPRPNIIKKAKIFFSQNRNESTAIQSQLPSIRHSILPFLATKQPT